MKSYPFCLFLLLLACTCNFAEGLWGSGKTDQQKAKDLGHKAAEDARLSAKYARDAAADTLEAAKAQGRAFTGGAKQRAQDYYDSAGNVISNLRDYAGTVYDRTGNALGDAKGFVYERAHDYYDSAGNLIDDLKGYAGTVYDQTGNALGDAKDYVYDTASEYYDKAGDAKDFAFGKAHDYYDSTGNAIGNIRDYVGTVYDRTGNALGDAKDFVFDSARRKANNYYDKAGNAIGNIRGYAGTVYDKAGNALGDAKDFAYDRAHDYYDNAGNVIDNIREYAGNVYDRAGNVLGDAKDFANEKASEKLHRAGDYFQHRPADRPCRRLVNDACACVKSFFPTTFFSLLLTLAALSAASYFIYTRMLGKRLNAKDLKRQTKQLGNTIKAKAGEAREKVNELGHRAKETIGTKLNSRANGHDEGYQEGETTHEYNLRTNRAPVVHYSDDQWTANGHTENTAEMMEGEDGVLLENK